MATDLDLDLPCWPTQPRTTRRPSGSGSWCTTSSSEWCRPSLPTTGRLARAALITTQVLGLAFCRYVVRLPQVAALDVETIVAAVGSVIQRYPCRRQKPEWSRRGPSLRPACPARNTVYSDGRRRPP
ncbi:TetR/AcrR family transcriptional regulator [Jatrophihabitans lederbergiae]|uniref:TetR/AcrR family transcriptional regulator n=1 Tax=Jatrophihabitans lederbergiae TaxID=3075547 RepID=UPI0037C02959